MTVCLNMIVKNEAHVIQRCLESVLPFIDRWVIVDTGSTDGTQEIIRACLANVPGELHERPWRNFGFNRTEALQMARPQADYLLFIDADETLRAPTNWHWPNLSGDAYFLNTEYGGIVYDRLAVVSTRHDWRWEGVLHEYLTTGFDVQRSRLDGPCIVVAHDGARARDPETYKKDVAILEQALREEPGNARYAFYLAQSLRDAGELSRAREAYRQRAAMGGWEEEVWFSKYRMGQLSEAMGESSEQVQADYLAAYQARPSRAEPLHALARYHRLRRDFHLAYMFAKLATAIPFPAEDLLFVEKEIYDWRCQDELSVAASYTGAMQEGLDIVENLLSQGKFPVADRPRLEANLDFFRRALLIPVEKNAGAPVPIPIVWPCGEIGSKKIAVVTPYFKEDRMTLERCIQSVASQTIESDHILVSDGFPQDWIDELRLRHIKLDRSHGDFGDTPRGLGAQLAIAEKYDGICFLDADNWFDADHVEQCLKAAESLTGRVIDCDYVIAARRLVRPDMTVMEWIEESDHVDTNCFFFLPGSYFVLPQWNLIPREFSSSGDRYFYSNIKDKRLVFCRTGKISVNYFNLWESTYRGRGELMPTGAKPNIDMSDAYKWYSGQDLRRRTILERLLSRKP